MKDFELRYVGSHVEVYTGSGVFLFSGRYGAGSNGRTGRVSDRKQAGTSAQM